jgi:hypothetical protein
MQKGIVVFLVLLLAAPSVLGVGTISKIINLDFEPHLRFNTSYRFFDANNISINITGGLAQYARLEDPCPNCGPRTVHMYLELPANLTPPGRHGLTIVGTELPEGNSMIQAVAAIATPLYVHVPYPGYYATHYLELPHVELGEQILVRVVLSNLGQNTLTDTVVKLEFTDELNDTIGVFDHRFTQPIPPGKHELNFSVDSASLHPARYKVFSTLFYHGKNHTRESALKVGDTSIEVTSYTKELFAGRINKFVIKVEANWRPKQEVYATISIDGSKLATTPTIALEKFGRGQLEGYIDAGSLELGEHELSMNVVYGKESKSFSGKVRVVEPTAESPVVEAPKSDMNLTLVMLAGMGAIVIIIAMFLLFYIMVRKK